MALCAFSEKELVGDRLPKTWEEFCVSNCYNGEKIKAALSFSHVPVRNVFRDYHDAEKHIALMKLHLLRDEYRQGWKPDWDDNNKKYYISHYDNSNNCRVYQESIFPNFLSFQTEELATEFLGNFRDLIEQAGDLI